MSKTSIRPCDCKHEFQDKTYGTGNRVHNEAPKKGFTCTVCGKSKK